jgi:general stress protein 26
MAQSTGAERVYDLVDEIGVCMLTSKAGASLRARPMHAKARLSSERPDMGENRKVAMGGRR